MSAFSTARLIAQDKPTTDLYVPYVLKVTNCPVHGAEFGDPCFTAPPINKRTSLIVGICNNRALSAGMNGPISPASMKERPKHDRRFR